MFRIAKNCNFFNNNGCFSYRFLSGLNLWNEELNSEIKHKIENYWCERIKAKDFDENDRAKEKYYVLSMFPYPSGHLHMGHVRVYSISDSVARFQRMNGKNVVHPIGWDAFGLPAENAAIDRKIPPDEWTRQNISYMKKQLQQLGCSFEWKREIATCETNYYKWTQDLFLKLFNSGLVYQKEALVNWDPVDETVLADEQVDENGCSWRSGAKVEKKLLKQWFIRTTSFAKDLLDGLNDDILHDWRDIIKIQKHWIGECDGVSFDFQLFENDSSKSFVSLWTDKPEYLENAKFVAVTSSNILAKFEGDTILEGTRKLHLEAKNPLTNEKIPIFVTDQIEFLDLTDSYLGIPGVCEQDTNFAKKLSIFFEIPPIFSSTEKENKTNSNISKAQQLKAGGYRTSAKLKDWLISRQRYWGTPIPIIHCDTCGIQPVSKDKLPVELPKLSKQIQKGSSQLADCAEWLNTTCPKCKGAAQRETDTMDTFVDSSWYFLRYLNPNDQNEMFDVKKAKFMTPVDLYIGGKEHAVLHLYYARFVSHFLHSLGLLPEREPFKRLLVQGMVMGQSYRVKGSGQYLLGSKVKFLDKKKTKAIDAETGNPVVIAWEKMSKSKHNGVDPSDMFKQYGVDTTRLLILADVAPTSPRNWNSNTFPGIINWQRRLWLTIKSFLNHRSNLPKSIPEDEFKKQDDYMFDSRNYYIKGTTFNYCTSQQLSIAVSKMQGLTNSIRRAPPAIFAHSLQFERALATQIILLAPMAPHFASELWSGFISAPNRLNNTNEIQWDKTVLDQTWPRIDLDYKLDLVCQVNGCENRTIKIPKNKLEHLSKDEAVKIVLNQKDIQDVLENRTVFDVSYQFVTDYEGIVNIVTHSQSQKKTALEENQ